MSLMDMLQAILWISGINLAITGYIGFHYLVDYFTLKEEKQPQKPVQKRSIEG